MRLLLLVLMCSTLILAIDDQKTTAKTTAAATEKTNDKATEEKTEKATEKAADKAEEKTADKGTEDKAEASNSTELDICKKCSCQTKEKTIDCEDLDIETMFTEQQLIALNDSKVPLDIFRINNNELTVITPFPALPIRVLNLHRNKISKIEKGAFCDLTELEELDLSSNALTTKALSPEVFEGHYSPTEFEPLQKLKILRLGHNQLHALNQDLFEHLSSLEVLSIDSNPILVIDSLTTIALGDLPNLKFLDMSYLELTEVPIHLFNHPRDLHTLNLTGNLLTEVPEALRYAVNLETLYLDENIIEHIGYGNKGFPIMNKLDFLSISYTGLKSIGSGALSNLTALRTLMITNNPHLSIIHPNALSRKGADDPRQIEYPPLTNLYLHNNNLSRLDANLFPRYEKLDIVDIRFNPWVCDCDNQWLITNLLPVVIQKHPTMSEDIVCHIPAALTGMELTQLLNKSSMLRCLDKYNHTPERDGSILVGMLIGVLIGIPLALGMVFLYKRGCFGLSSNRGAAAYSRAFYKRAEMGDEFHI